MRALEVTGILVLLLLSIASAEEEPQNTSLDELFASGDASILPPPIEGSAAGGPLDNGSEDGEEMAGTMPLRAPSAPGMLAAEANKVVAGLNTLTLNIKDISTYEPITNAHIRLYLDDGSQQVGTLRFVGEDGRMVLQLPPATWDITLKLDLTDTPGKDFYSQFEVMLNSDENLTAFMQPVGSLTGDVVDQDNNLIPSAQIKLECSGDYGETGPLSSDEFGSFSADWLPVGSCKVSALSGRAGSSTVEITRGGVASVRITLQQGVANAAQDYAWMIALAVAVLVPLAAFAMMKKGSGQPREDEGPEEIEPDSRMGDILHALDENERRILELLMTKGGESQQNIIGRELDFPKSSLSRAVRGLKARNLVETERLGRVKRVELSDWFLNGKKP